MPDNLNTDDAALLGEAHREIEIEVLDLFACVLHTAPAQRGGGAMTPDVAQSLTLTVQRAIHPATTPHWPDGEPEQAQS